MNESGILPAKASSCASGSRLPHRQAWRYCHTLTVVKLPSSVVAIANAAFQGCNALTTVAMPGRVSLGARLFAECCALEQVGVLTENSCRLARRAVSPYAFEGCEKLVQIGLPLIRAVTDTRVAWSSLVGLPTGCFHSAGIRVISMPRATAFIRHKAFAQCPQLLTWTFRKHKWTLCTCKSFQCVSPIAVQKSTDAAYKLRPMHLKGVMHSPSQVRFATYPCGASRSPKGAFLGGVEKLKHCNSNG